jgi:hypothetical protein
VQRPIQPKVALPDSRVGIDVGVYNFGPPKHKPPAHNARAGSDQSNKGELRTKLYRLLSERDTPISLTAEFLAAHPY